MTQRDFLIQVSLLLDKLWNPADMERSQIISCMRFAIMHRWCKRYKKSDEELDAAWQFAKAMIEKKREAGF